MFLVFFGERNIFKSFCTVCGLYNQKKDGYGFCGSSVDDAFYFIFGYIRWIYVVSSWSNKDGSCCLLSKDVRME